MSIDTARKRGSAVASRRLPWLRRFTLPVPDGFLDGADREQLLAVYVPIESTPVVIAITGSADSTIAIRGRTDTAIAINARADNTISILASAE